MKINSDGPFFSLVPMSFKINVYNNIKLLFQKYEL